MDRRKNMVVMVKPSSALCNMRCTYCFYRDEAENRVKGIRPFMEKETASILIEKIGKTTENCLLAFQGGEPSLIGLDWFRFVIAEEKRLAPETRFRHTFQTNGYILDAEWADFFKENDFLVGVSFDGARRIHDMYRPDRGGKKTADRILANIGVLEEKGVDYNILMVVTKTLAQNPLLVWNFLRGRNFRFVQFIPCMDPLDGESSDYSLTDADYRTFLFGFYELWLDAIEKGQYVSVRHFDNYVHMAAGRAPESCDMNGMCSVEYVVESDGQVYPCDFWSMDKWRLGTITEDSFEDFDRKRKELRFIEDSPTKASECKTCNAFWLCRGGCPRYRENGKYKYCGTLKEFAQRAYPSLAAIAREFQLE